MKKYFVMMDGKRWRFTIHTNSLNRALKLADLRIWKYSKVHLMEFEGKMYNKCIYINDRRES